MPKWQPAGVSPDTRTMINAEWGSFNSPLLPRLEEDRRVDEASSCPGETGEGQTQERVP
jgi:hexokinase